jgi:hypothetical protein
VAPKKLMGRVKRSEDRFELRVVLRDDDIGGVEAEPFPPARLEPIWAFRADQREHSARRRRALEFKDCCRIGLKARATHGQLSPSVHNRQRVEESSPDVGTGASVDKNASQPRGGFYADELSRSRAQIHGEPAAARGHLENPPSIDLELRKDPRVNGLGLADGVPELRFELIYHRPEQSSTEAPSCLSVPAGGRFLLTGRDRGQVFARQPSNIIQAVALPARRSGGSSLEVIHF